MEYMRSPQGVQVESTWSPPGIYGIYRESTGSPQGVPGSDWESTGSDWDSLVIFNFNIKHIYSYLE
jgi:hypothetical protein